MLELFNTPINFLCRKASLQNNEDMCSIVMRIIYRNEQRK
jgi:hypothetical protein